MERDRPIGTGEGHFTAPDPDFLLRRGFGGQELAIVLNDLDCGGDVQLCLISVPAQVVNPVASQKDLVSDRRFVTGAPPAHSRRDLFFEAE
jgi:hypothetical protein